MNKAERFFYDNAGFSYGQDESPEDGRLRCAVLMAEAERWAARNGIEFTWEDDFEITDHVAEFDCYDQEPGTCEGCVARSRKGGVVASLWCIDDATPEYRRVIEAELAMEAMG